MAEQGKADMEEQIKNLEEEKRQLEQQVCAYVFVCVCVCPCLTLKKPLDCGFWEKRFMCHQLPLDKSLGIKYTEVGDGQDHWLCHTQQWHRLDGLRVSVSWLEGISSCKHLA